MTNTKLLLDEIERSGLRTTKIAEWLGLSYNAFICKVRNERSFKVDEYYRLCRILNITSPKLKEAIFLLKNLTNCQKIKRTVAIPWKVNRLFFKSTTQKD